MPALKYLGPTGDDNDVLNRLRLQTEVSGNITPTSVDQQITTALNAKANATYLGNRSSQYATPSAISDRSATLIPRSQGGQPNGPVPLLSSGRASGELLPNAYERTGGRGWKKVGEWTASNLSLTTGSYSSTTEQQIGSFTTSNPGYTWLPIFVGNFTIGLGKGEVNIKRGTRFIARGIGGNWSSAWFTCDIIPTDITTYTGAQTFTVTRRACFSPGSMNLASGFHFVCFAVPA